MYLTYAQIKSSLLVQINCFISYTNTRPCVYSKLEGVKFCVGTSPWMQCSFHPLSGL